MKTIAIIAAIAAVTVSATAYAAHKPQTHRVGDPIKHGKYCWVATDSRGSGWWDMCDPNERQPRGLSQRGLSETEISRIEHGGGGDGGGGR